MSKTVNSIEGVKFNEGDLADVKRDIKKLEFDTEDLKKQLLYLEAYSRRENLKFAGIPESLPDENQGDQGKQIENTKALVYDFMEQELKMENPRARIEFQRCHFLGKSNSKGQRLIVDRFLRFCDQE